MTATCLISPATEHEAQQLAEIRAEAMRPSLEAVGRFDPERVRARFLSTFVAADTFALRRDGAIIGFYVRRRRKDHLYLDHLYIRRDCQGLGLGRQVVERVQEEARRLALPIRLLALADSPANGFYIAHGFRFERSEGVDNHYAWHAS
jgi:GNAT superfamily N-acetyltransferase